MTVAAEAFAPAGTMEPAANRSSRGRALALRALVRFEIRSELRGRTLPAFTIGFALLACAVALVGLSAGGTLTIQGFARTSVSLLQLSLWLVPLIALTTSAVAAADIYETEWLTAQPVSRGTLVVGRALGRMLGLGAALTIGYGLAGLLIAGGAGSGDARRFLGMLVAALALVTATTAVGTLAGVLARTRTRALGLAVGLWFVLVVGVDFAAIGLLSVMPRAELTWSLSALLVLSPVDAVRALGAALFDAEALAGPMGAALRRVLGPSGMALLATGLVLWTTVPLAVAVRLVNRRDLC